MLVDKPSPDRRREAVHEQYHDDRRSHQRRNLRIIEEVHGDQDLLPYPSGSDEAQYGRRADVALPLVERERGEAAERLWEPPEEEGLQRAGPGRSQGFDRTRRHRLERLAQELAQDAGGVNRQGEGPGEGAEAQSHHEDQRPQDVRDGAEDVQYEARQVVGDGPEEAFAPRGAGRGCFCRCKGGEREGDHGPDERPEKGHLEGLEDALGGGLEGLRREVGREHARDESLDGTGAGEEPDEVEADPRSAPAGQAEDDEHREGGLPAQAWDRAAYPPRPFSERRRH